MAVLIAPDTVDLAPYGWPGRELFPIELAGEIGAVTIQTGWYAVEYDPLIRDFILASGITPCPDKQSAIDEAIRLLQECYPARRPTTDLTPYGLEGRCVELVCMTCDKYTGWVALEWLPSIQCYFGYQPGPDVCFATTEEALAYAVAHEDAPRAEMASWSSGKYGE